MFRLRPLSQRLIEDNRGAQHTRTQALDAHYMKNLAGSFERRLIFPPQQPISLIFGHRAYPGHITISLFPLLYTHRLAALSPPSQCHTRERVIDE